jgi:hypothetical protein
MNTSYRKKLTRICVNANFIAFSEVTHFHILFSTDTGPVSVGCVLLPMAL